MDKESSTNSEHVAKMCCENIKLFVSLTFYMTGLVVNVVAYAMSPVLIFPAVFLWVAPFVLIKGVDNPFVTMDYYKRRTHRLVAANSSHSTS